MHLKNTYPASQAKKAFENRTDLYYVLFTESSLLLPHSSLGEEKLLI